MVTYITVWTQIRHTSIIERLRDLRGDRKGVTAMEYGIIAAVTVAAVGAAIVSVGTSLSTIWTSIKTTMATAAG
jgi:pilus assembly protein Flp/PilA